MEVLAFILQRFYYSLASGFIINLFVIFNFYVLDKKNLLPRYIKLINDISMPEIVKVVIFIVTVIIVGIFIEGINESCFQYYKTLYDKKKIYVPKRRKPKENRKTFLGFLLWHIFRRVGIVEACLSFTDKSIEDKLERNWKNPLYDFMRDHNFTDPEKAMLTCEKVIVSRNIKSEINMYRSFSFIIQLARVSFLLIAVICFISMIIITAVWGYEKILKCVDNWAVFNDLFFFYVAGVVVSLFIVITTTPMAIDFGIRYVRDVGRWYKAINISATIPYPNSEGLPYPNPNKGEKPQNRP